METQIQYLNDKYGADIRLLSTPNVEISSSEIRKKIKLGEDIKAFIPESVYSYIQTNNLFKDDENESV